MIEALVALAVVMVVLGAVGSLFARSTHGAQRLNQHVELMEAARLIASGIPHGGATFPNDLEGETSGYRWQMRLSPLIDNVEVPDSRFLPWRVELRVRSPSGAMVSLETVRLLTRSERR